MIEIILTIGLGILTIFLLGISVAKTIRLSREMKLWEETFEFLKCLEERSNEDVCGTE